LTQQIQPFLSGDPALRNTLNQIIRSVNALNRMTGDGMVRVNHTETGMALSLAIDNLRPRVGGLAASGEGSSDIAMLFEIQSAATGPGIYNCLPAWIDSSEWNVAGERDIINVKTEGQDPPVEVTETQQVLNLDEIVNITDQWALGTAYADGDWTLYGPNDTDYRAIAAHCAGGCITWEATTWTIGDRCRYTGNAYKLTNSNKTGSDTTPPDGDGDWVVDNDEPTVGNAWQDYWDTGPAAKMEDKDLLLAFNVTDDEGVTRLVGRSFGLDFIKQFFEECS
jgi:hypothetical protein